MSIRHAIITLTLVTGAAALWLVSYGELIVLVAKDQVPVGLQPYKPFVEENLLMVLQPDDTVTVIGCEDGKSDVYMMVLSASGASGYISGGDYFVVRKNGLFVVISNWSNITYSCIGWLGGITHPSN